MTEQTFPGWLEDPSASDLYRYWDGRSWTAHTAARVIGGVVVGPPPPRPPAEAQTVHEHRSSRDAAPLDAPVADHESQASALTTTKADASQTPQPRQSLIGRLLGLKTDAEKAAAAAHEELMASAGAGGTELATLRQRLDELASQADVSDRKTARLSAQAFRAAAERMLRDDVLSETEESELMRLAQAIGVNAGAMEARMYDLHQRLAVARINDGRLPIVPNPRLLIKRGELVHAEVEAALLKEVVHREYRGGSSGVSIPIGFGVRYRTSGFRGRSVVVGTSWEPADIGVLSITDRRVVFSGQRKTQECRYDRLVSSEAFSDAIQLGVSNRQTASVFRVPDGVIAGALVSVAAQRLLYS